MKNFRKLLLSPSGRIARMPFIIGALALLVLFGIQHYLYPVLGTGLLGFFVPMAFFFLNMHIIFCICGKRLHDMGRSAWPLFFMFSLLMAVTFFVGLKFGMLEYFESVSALMNDPLLQQDTEAMRAAVKPLEEAYQSNLKANMGKISVLLAVIPAAFTAWLAMVPGQKSENRYGSTP
ncbi:MAG TPA: DUF805 domain-containing protein [Ghiorsea sp.]|nr:DUF805 domain-containing protein [Ghiorsea sp.]